ncbi:MAG: hypothetical protein ABI591_12915 [Kofleriaceae bacterium]
MQWIVSTERTPAWQLDLAAIDRTSARTLDLYTAPAEHQLTRRESRAVRLAPSEVRVPRPYEQCALVLQHRADRGRAGGDHELTEVSTDHVGDRELHDRFYFLELLLPGSVLHDGLSG